MNKKITFKIDKEGRADSVLHEKFPDYSRNYFINLIKSGNVKVNGKTIKPALQAKIGDDVELEFSDLDTQINLTPENIPLNIIFEDNNVLVVNKAPGIVVHPAAGNKSGTLVNALLNYFPDIKDSIHEKDNQLSRMRAGIVHRLDKDTSGAIIIAKNSKTLYSLSKQIKDRAVSKIYWALCLGWPKHNEGKLVNYLGRHPKNRKIVADIGPEKGREAISFYKVLRHLKFNDQTLSLIEFKIKTGRTHQIRVQSSLIGNPVIGDSVYGNKTSCKLSSMLKAERQLLHAKSLSITIPGEKIQRAFISQLPEDFENILSKLTSPNS